MIMKNQNTNERILLLYCCKSLLSSEDKSTIKTMLNDSHIDPLVLRDLAYKHAVLPLLYTTLKAIVPKHSLCRVLKPYYTHIIQRNLAMTSHLVQLVTLFKTHYFPVLALKGSALAYTLYGNLTLRQFGDIDILIHIRDKQSMIRMMKKEGYIPQLPLTEATKKTFISYVNVIGFYTPDKSILIEIHWKLLSQNYAVSWEEEQLWKNISFVPTPSYDLPTLAFKQQFLYLCLHGSKHLFERLSWVCDIDRSLRVTYPIPWDALLADAKALGIYRIVLLSLSLSHTLLDSPLPQEIHDFIHQDTKVAKLTSILIDFQRSNTPPKSYYHLILLCTMREKYQDKMRVLWFGLFTAKFDDFKWIQLPSYLRFLYPLLRPLRLMMKYFG
ncbi:MAG: nucleotidyltransferase family protein [Sulfurovum sp.]|nr:nucleotidyltransferase family protein [Sulfurovum sp.]